MQPYGEARSLNRQPLGGHEVPPYSLQIGDGENGGVMMNEFPPKFMDVVRQASGSETPLVNVTEYLEHLYSLGIREADLPPLQPLFQDRIWQRLRPGDGPDKLAAVIDELRRQDGRFNVEGGSWTNNLSWVRGYDNVLGPMDEVSALFAQRVLAAGVPTSEYRYQNALYHLLVSQTSCYRYWGQGLWTDYAREICRRARDILQYDFPSP
jgi:hypothetical protein